jgi:antitoxin HicB
LLSNETVKQKIRPAELARRLNTTPQEVNRLTNFRHTNRIDGIATAWNAVGWRKKRTIRAGYRRLTYCVELSTTV